MVLLVLTVTISMTVDQRYRSVIYLVGKLDTFRMVAVSAVVLDDVRLVHGNGWTSRTAKCSSHSLTYAHYYCANGHSGTFSSDHH